MYIMNQYRPHITNMIRTTMKGLGSMETAIGLALVQRFFGNFHTRWHHSVQQQHDSQRRRCAAHSSRNICIGKKIVSYLKLKFLNIFSKILKFNYTTGALSNWGLSSLEIWLHQINCCLNLHVWKICDFILLF